MTFHSLRPHGARRPDGSAGRRVVVVGGGIAGMGAALGLASHGCEVTLIEAEPTIGGACRAVTVPLPGREPVAIDLGVSDFNRATFGRLATLLGELALPLQPVCQDASYRDARGRWLWSSTAAGPVFADHVDRGFADEVARFRVEAARVVDPRWRAGDWLRAHGFSDAFRRLYFAPRAAGCFPAPALPPADMPIRALARFWGMHGLVGPAPADRVCVRGGMHGYLPAMQARLRSLGVTLRLGERVHGIERGVEWGVEGVTVHVHGAHAAIGADALVLAVAPEQALRLLSRPDADERRLLSACRTQPGRVVLHRDARLMPHRSAHWAAYNYLVPDDDRAALPPTISFFPQRLAQLPGALPPLFVTLNPRIEPRGTIAEATLAHPLLGRDDAIATALRGLQGRHGTWYCGAWTGEPYLHEQGLASGLDVAESIAGPRQRAAA